MRTYIEINQVDLSLSAGQRTALGLGPIGSDPRDAAVRASLCEENANKVRCIVSFAHAFERAATTRSSLRAALVARARVLLDAHRDTEAEGAIVGTRIAVD